jgi:hypothetical protein
MINNANNDPLSDALGINPMTTVNNTVKDIISTAYNDSATNDFEMARSNIHEVIQTGQ